MYIPDSIPSECISHVNRKARTKLFSFPTISRKYFTSNKKLNDLKVVRYVLLSNPIPHAVAVAVAVAVSILLAAIKCWAIFISTDTGSRSFMIVE